MSEAEKYAVPALEAVKNNGAKTTDEKWSVINQALAALPKGEE